MKRFLLQGIGKTALPSALHLKGWRGWFSQKMKGNKTWYDGYGKINSDDF